MTTPEGNSVLADANGRIPLALISHDGHATPAQERERHMTVGESLKLAAITRRQTMEQANREIELALRDSVAMRAMAEDIRSLHRNRNRLSVYLVGFIVSIVWPLLVGQMFGHNPSLMGWTTAVSTLGNVAVVFYAYVKRY